VANKLDLKKEFEKMTLPQVGGRNNFSPEHIKDAIGYLGMAIMKLDATSSRLAIVNIVLTVVLVGIGVLQVILMFRGK